VLAPGTNLFFFVISKQPLDQSHSYHIKITDFTLAHAQNIPEILMIRCYFTRKALNMGRFHCLVDEEPSSTTEFAKLNVISSVVAHMHNNSAEALCSGRVDPELQATEQTVP
jgi:hypothetical protein